MAGFWHLSGTNIFDSVARPAGGAQAFFYASDTLTDLVVYRDSALLTPYNQPVIADGFGVWPNVYLDNSAGGGYFRYRVTSAEGEELRALNTVPILSSAAGGGGGGTVDATTLIQTGFVMWGLTALQINGWVRLNNKSIGSSTSGATERANSTDCQALFLFLWNNFLDITCPVSTGRGASASADWGANKNIGLPDMRGRAAWGRDTMGGVGAASRITASSTPNPDTAAENFGAETVTLVGGNLPAHAHTIPSTVVVASGAGATVTGSTGSGQNSGNGPGASTAFNKMPWGKLGTWYMKL